MRGDVAMLLALFERWRELTLAEAQAIDVSAWHRLEEHQAEKRELQEQIRASVGSSAPTADASFDPLVRDEPRLRNIVSELIQLERQNLERLATRRTQAEGTSKALDQATRQLRQIHRSYAPAVGAANWQSVS